MFSFLKKIWFGEDTDKCVKNIVWNDEIFTLLSKFKGRGSKIEQLLINEQFFINEKEYRNLVNSFLKKT